MSLGGGFSSSLNTAVNNLASLRRVRRGGCRQQQRGRVQLLSLQRREHHDCRLVDHLGREVLVLELWRLRRSLRAGKQHHLGLA